MNRPAVFPVRLTTSLGGVVIEEGHGRDARSFRDLKREILTEGQWFVTEVDECDDSEARTRQLVDDLCQATNGLFLVARAGQRLAGVLVIQGGALRRLHHVAHLEIYVQADYRGLGLGDALMAAGKRWSLRNPEIHKVSLAVLSHNERAVALYRKHGFFEEGRRSREYLFPDGTFRDDILMALFVGE